jgi:hypothetical protein
MDTIIVPDKKRYEEGFRKFISCLEAFASAEEKEKC